MTQINELAHSIAAIVAQNWTTIANSQTASGWAQVIVSCVVLVVATITVVIQYYIRRRDAKRTTLSAVDYAFGRMKMAFNMGIGVYSNEWDAFKWEPIIRIVEECPIHDTNNAAAIKSFMQFCELLRRAEELTETCVPPPTMRERLLSFLEIGKIRPRDSTDDILIPSKIVIMQEAAIAVDELHRFLGRKHGSRK